VKKPAWEHKKRFGIHDRMKEIILLSKDASEKEIKRLKRKVRKLQYGS